MKFTTEAAVNATLDELRESKLAMLAFAEMVRKARHNPEMDGITILLAAFALGVLYGRNQLQPEEPKHGE